MGLSRETPHVTDRPQDRRGQNGTYTEDLREAGAGGAHLGFDARVQVGDLPLQRTDVAQHLGGQPPAQALRGAAPGPHAAQDSRDPISRELPGHPTREEAEA